MTDLVPMEERDVADVTRLLAEYHSSFVLAPKLNQDDIKHLLLPLDNVIHSYVVRVF